MEPPTMRHPFCDCSIVNGAALLYYKVGQFSNILKMGAFKKIY
jgi:hypothetical protein